LKIWSKNCEGVLKIVRLNFWLAYVITSLDARENTAQAIVFTRLRGQAIPGVNIQNKKGKAKAYQVRQVLKAIEKLQSYEDPSK